MQEDLALAKLKYLETMQEDLHLAKAKYLDLKAQRMGQGVQGAGTAAGSAWVPTMAAVKAANANATNKNNYQFSEVIEEKGKGKGQGRKGQRAHSNPPQEKAPPTKRSKIVAKDAVQYSGPPQYQAASKFINASRQARSRARMEDFNAMKIEGRRSSQESGKKAKGKKAKAKAKAKGKAKKARKPVEQTRWIKVVKIVDGTEEEEEKVADDNNEGDYEPPSPRSVTPVRDKKRTQESSSDSSDESEKEEPTRPVEPQAILGAAFAAPIAAPVLNGQLLDQAQMYHLRVALGQLTLAVGNNTVTRDSLVWYAQVLSATAYHIYLRPPVENATR